MNSETKQPKTTPRRLSCKSSNISTSVNKKERNSVIKSKSPKYKWRWVKGGQGYGHEIINGEGQRIAILDCQQSLWEEYSFGYSIVPKADVELKEKPDPHADIRPNDADLDFNARLIRNAPKMYDLLCRVVNNLFEGESTKGSLQGDVYDALYEINEDPSFKSEWFEWE